MSDPNPDQYAHVFAGKTERELREIATPPDLSYHDAMAFRVARRLAIDIAKKTASPAGRGPSPAPSLEPAPATVSSADQPAAIDKRHFGPYADRAPLPDANLEPIDSPPAAPVAEAIPLIIPMGRCEELLERQLASGAGLIEHLVQYIARYDSDLHSCLQFADRICSVMKSSAGVAKAVGRLRGLAPDETRHRILVECAPPRGEGVLRA
jgi:hypothetical protein